MIDVFHKLFSNDSFVAFHYKSYGTFLILKKPYNSRAVLPTIETVSYTHLDVYKRQEGTFESLTTSLANKFKSNGGNILLRSEVDKVAIENNIVKGIVLKRKKEFIRAKKGVISSGDFLKAVNKLTGTKHYPKRYISKINKLSLPLSVFQTYIVTTDAVSYTHLDVYKRQ